MRRVRIAALLQRKAFSPKPLCPLRWATDQAMKPITFSCEATLPLTPAGIASQILDLANWPAFTGFGPVPGIKTAEFELRTSAIVGSRIRVTNTDGSSHIEEIVAWHPTHQLELRMQDFSAPLSRLATRFEETWEFERTEGATKVTRWFELHPNSSFARPFLWLISFFLRRAIARHLRQMAVAPRLSV
jgi:hypothetical protein